MTMKSQSNLLTKKRFLPYFITQALGAFNDNIYKNVLLILIAYTAIDSLPFNHDILINLAAGLFILPFFLFSASAGILADKYDKARFIRRVKLAEIIIMSFAAIAFLYQNYLALLFLLFLMGTQSAFFGPAKYAILPQHLKKEELISGNALVETGTFLAILFGTMIAGVISSSPHAIHIVSVSVIIIAILGYISALKIPPAPPSDSQLTFKWQPIRHTRRTMSIAFQDKIIFQCMMGISWFWFLGACYLTQFPNFAKINLGGGAASISFLLTLFSIGIAIGSLLCDRLTQHRVDPGLVPVGSLGMTFFGIGIYFTTPDIAPVSDSIIAFISNPTLWPLFISLLLFSISCGVFIVPLYALMQQRAKENQRAQIIAANNIWNSAFMVVSTLFAIVCLALLELSIPQFFLILAVLNGLVMVYIYFQAPEFFWRFVVWLVTHTMYRVNRQNLERIPTKGGVLIVSNHVSYIDPLLLAGAYPRPIRFLMDKDWYHSPIINTFSKACKAIPVDGNDSRSVRQAFNRVAQYLENGDVVCVFPEGSLTPDGEIAPFMRGIDLIIKRSKATVVPIGLQGLWGSYFSREGGRALLKMPKRFWSKVTINVGHPVPFDEANSKQLREQVIALRGNNK